MDTALTTTLPIVGAAAVAAAAYIDGKFGISNDLRSLSWEREWGARLGQRIAALGDTVTLYGMFQKIDPNIDCLWFEGQTWSYGETKNYVDRFAAFLEGKGLKKGDTVALFTTNSPEMYITVLALSKLSVVAGMINTSLRADVLKHCLKISQATAIISTPDLSAHMIEPLPHFSVNLGSFNTIISSDASITDIKLQDLPSPAFITPATKAKITDLSLLIFTSGTTGKPKACAIRNHLCMVTSNPATLDMRCPSLYYPLRTYSPLPLFHGTAFLTGICASLGTSGTLCLARKFSASRFWKDVHDSKATRILYVGELCRYLVNSPPSPYDQGHNCIVASGNGLRAEIWEKFKTRFAVPEIREFYRSTEGLAKYDNMGKGSWGAGKVGFAGLIRKYLENDTIIIRVDQNTEEPYRNPKTGFCVQAAQGEAGEVIGRVKNRDVLIEYLGNSKATNEKIMRDVFVKGDVFQKMGDLLIHEKEGWIRFHDRMGDTFRWKGENVSAGEVRDHIAKLDGVLDAVVYGVKLPAYDGQAGAAAITIDSNADAIFMTNLPSGLKKTGLPAYAMPRLVRISKEIEANATFKKAKTELVKKSWKQAEKEDSDILYWLDGMTYRPLDKQAWEGIESGRAKL